MVCSLQSTECHSRHTAAYTIITWSKLQADLQNFPQKLDVAAYYSIFLFYFWWNSQITYTLLDTEIFSLKKTKNKKQRLFRPLNRGDFHGYCEKLETGNNFKRPVFIQDPLLSLFFTEALNPSKPFRNTRYHIPWSEWNGTIFSCLGEKQWYCYLGKQPEKRSKRKCSVPLSRLLKAARRSSLRKCPSTGNSYRQTELRNSRNSLTQVPPETMSADGATDYSWSWVSAHYKHCP